MSEFFQSKFLKEKSDSKTGEKSLEKFTVTANIHHNGYKIAFLILSQSTICVNYNPLSILNSFYFV